MTACDCIRDCSDRLSGTVVRGVDGARFQLAELRELVPQLVEWCFVDERVGAVRR